MLNATNAGGCACTIAFISNLALYMARWKGYSDEGLWSPIMDPSAFIQTISDGFSKPLSTPVGVIQMSPLSSMIDKLPPEVVVNTLL